MAGNLVISIVMATALQYLWGMVNALQIMVLGIFFNLLNPPNQRIIMIEILKSTAFDFYQTEIYYTEFFGFLESESLSDTFDEADVQGSVFITGIGPVFLCIALFPIYVLVHRSA